MEIIQTTRGCLEIGISEDIRERKKCDSEETDSYKHVHSVPSSAAIMGASEDDKPTPRNSGLESPREPRFSMTLLNSWTSLDDTSPALFVKSAIPRAMYGCSYFFKLLITST